MNSTLLVKELREARWKIVLGILLMSLLAVSIPLLFDYIRDLLSGLAGQPGPFGQLVPMIIIENYSVYLWSQWHAKNLYQMGIILAILLGMSAVAGEVSSQTIQFLLARPVSRRTVYVTKAAAGALALMLVIAVSTGALLAAAFTQRYALDAGRLVVVTLLTSLGLLVVYALSLFFSTVIDEPVKAAGASLLTLAFFWGLNFFPATRPLSLFTHIHGTEYFLGGIFPALPVVVMSGAVTGLLFAGAWFFEQKDF